MRLVIGAELLGDALQPVLQHRAGPGVQRREGADDAGLALGDDEVRVRHDEQR